jgi:hypothetical protein
MARLAAFSAGVSFPPGGFCFGLEDGDLLAEIPLDSHVLLETPAGREGRALNLHAALIGGFPFIGSAQEVNLGGLSHHEEVFDHGALQLAAGIVLLVLRIVGAVDRPLRTIMPTRADTGAPSVRLAASMTAQSSAVRAGSTSGWAHA